jgi:2',3'-cyclic-nucleotide 2'-phosphodiesterase/3'-nucleotidase
MMQADNRPVPGAAPRARLRLLATADLHMHLGGFDYHTDRPDPACGLTRIAGLIATARAEAAAQGAAVLLLDNGDGLQGTPMGDLAASRPQVPHPLMRAFALLGYDAIGLGNHDFDLGLESLQIVLAQSPCPVIGSNLKMLEPGLLPGIARFVILQPAWPADTGLPPLRVGLLSLVPPQTAQWNARHLAGRVTIADMVPAARRGAADLRAAGCDLVVALAHSGIGPHRAQPGMENAVIPLAALDGIDAIVAGHTHLRLPGPDHAGVAGVDTEAGTVLGKPVVMPGAGARHLGLIDLDLSHDAAQGWRITGTDTVLRPVVRRTPDGTITPQPESPALLRLIAGDHAATRAELARPAGHSHAPLHSYFSLIAPDRALALVAAAQAAALRAHLNTTAAGTLPVLSATAPSRSGGRAGPLHYTDVPAGALSWRHVADLCAFANHVAAVIVTGSQLRDWLEMSASRFHRIAPGSQGATLVDPGFPAHDFDVIHGIGYRIDLSAPARFAADGRPRPEGGRRIVDLCHGGRTIADTDRFTVALNDYRAAGGGQVAALTGAEPVPLPVPPLRAAVADYLSGRLPADPLAAMPPPWSFRPLPGTTVRFRTGPGAAAHLDDLSGRGANLHPDPDTDGFVHLNLPL